MNKEQEIARLNQEISSLRFELEEAEALIGEYSKASERGMLPIKGVECTGCKHCFFYYSPGGKALAIACDKDVACKDFEASEHTVKKLMGKFYGNNRIGDRITVELNQMY